MKFSLTKIQLLRVYLFVSVLIILNVVLYVYDKISFSGYWSDRIIFWLWLLLTPIVIIMYWNRLWSKVYAGLLVLALILSMLPMGVFFFGIYLSGTGIGRLNHFDLGNHLRVQTVAYGIMGAPRLQVVKDGVIFDKVSLEESDVLEVNDSVSVHVRDALQAKLERQTDSSITVRYFFKDTSYSMVHPMLK